MGHPESAGSALHGPTEQECPWSVGDTVSVAKACTVFSRGGAAQLEQHDVKDAD